MTPPKPCCCKALGVSNGTERIRSDHYAALADEAEQGVGKPETMPGHVAELLKEGRGKKIVIEH